MTKKMNRGHQQTVGAPQTIGIKLKKTTKRGGTEGGCRGQVPRGGPQPPEKNRTRTGQKKNLKKERDRQGGGVPPTRRWDRKGKKTFDRDSSKRA